MSIMLRLHCTTLESPSSPMPLSLRHSNFYETTVKELLKMVHNLLAKQYKGPYLELARSHLVLSVFFPKMQKYMGIENVKGATLLTELGLLPGSAIHVQDSRLVNGPRGALN